MADIATYRVSPFDRSSFSSPALLNPPQMQPLHTQRFLASLKAKTPPELVSTAELWEDTFLPTYPVPFFLVRVADIRASLNSNATALLLYQEAHKSIDDDPVFDEFLANFEQQCRTEEESHKAKWSQGIFNQPWKSTSKFLFPIIPLPPDAMSELLNRWKIMTSGEQYQQYFRYLCIETNILEQTFVLDLQAITQLIRVGYVDRDAQYLTKSKLQDKHLITSILRDTHQALEMIWAVASDTEKFTVDFLIDLHAVCLKTSKILPLKTKVDGNSREELQYTNIGTTRQESRKNVILPGPPRVQFSPFEKVMEEMGRITHLARQWLKNWKKNPFATAAWLHLVFVSCHPFEDGNGRVARLIASIPLIQAGLPPLCIPAIAKKTYYEGLNKARENNYDPLIRCFVQALETSVSAIEGLENDPSAMTVI